MTLRDLRFSHIASFFKVGKSRGITLSFAAVFLLFCLIIPNIIVERSSKQEVAALRKKAQEFSVLSAEYAGLKSRIDAIEQRAALKKVGGVAQALDETFSSPEIKKKMKSIKGAGSSVIDNRIAEERAEVQFERLTLNELINIFYRIEHGPVLLSIKGTGIKKAFENPDQLDVTMNVSLITQSPSELK